MNWYLLQGFYVIFSGMMQGLSVSNKFNDYGSPLIALVCLVPLYLAFYNCKSYKEAFRIGFFQAAIAHLISSFWLAFFKGYGIFTLGASTLGTALLFGLTSVIFYYFPNKIKNLNLKEYSGTENFISFKRIIWFTSYIVCYEWIKSTGFLAYPWGTISVAAYRWRIFTQIADVTGVYGITFIFVLANAVIAEFYLYFKNKNLYQNSIQIKNLLQNGTLCLVLFAVTGFYGIIQIIYPREKVKELNTIIVQQNTDSFTFLTHGEEIKIVTSMELTEEQFNQCKKDGIDVDVVLWSEGIFRSPLPERISYFETRQYTDETLTQFISRHKTPFIIGGITNVNPYKNKRNNSAILFDKNGKYSGFYSKNHLVPFAEQIPYIDNPLVSKFMKNVIGFYSPIIPGYQYSVFSIPLKSRMNNPTPLNYNQEKFSVIELNQNGTNNPEITKNYVKNNQQYPEYFVKIGTPICFEDAFADVSKNMFNLGTEVFLNISNDSWSKTKSAEYQHCIVASYRSIEYRTTMVRCCNSGLSCMITPTGKIKNKLPLFQEAAETIQVPIYRHKNTIYSVFGDWFVYTIITFLTIYFLFSLFIMYNKYITKFFTRIINFSKELIIKTNEKNN